MNTILNILTTAIVMSFVLGYLVGMLTRPRIDLPEGTQIMIDIDNIFRVRGGEIHKE